MSNPAALPDPGERTAIKPLELLNASQDALKASAAVLNRVAAIADEEWRGRTHDVIASSIALPESFIIEGLNVRWLPHGNRSAVN